MNYADSYREWVGLAETWAKRKARREEQLTAIAQRDVSRMSSKIGDRDVTVGFVANGMIVKDSIVAECELLRSRAVAVATMYGLGMIAEILESR